jgi:hypothetical protein
MGALPDAEAEITVRGIISGSTYDQLKSMQSEIMNQAGAIGDILVSAEKAPAGQRERLMALWQAARNKNLSARANWDKAKDAYNKIVNLIRSYSFGAVNRPSLSGFGVAPVVAAPAAIPPLAIAAIIVAGAIIIAQFTNFIAAARGDVNATRGYIDQAAEAMKQAGIAISNVIKEAAEAADKASSAALKTALTVGLVVGGWALFKWWQGRRGSRSVSVPITVTPQLDLKTVSGSVV